MTSSTVRGDLVQSKNLMWTALRGALAGAAIIAAMLGAPTLAAPVPLSTLVSSPVEGTWKTQDGPEITVTSCPEGFCGTLSWVVMPKAYQSMCEQNKAAFGALMLDEKNADPALRTRPILGLQMLTLAPTGDPNAFTAKIYNPQDGSTNDISVWIVAQDTMRIGGACLGTICAVTQDWPRVSPREVTPDFSCEGGQ